ncbi:MAG: alpha/beta fold hydrolase [Solirubrobacteraceae bacterium]
MAVEVHTAQLGDLPIRWRSAPSPAAPTLYVHGVPNASEMWLPFLARTGGAAPDLPGFGQSGKPAHFDYSIAGYDTFLEQFLALAQIDSFNLVVHDWGAVGLAAAQRLADRLERLVIINAVPLLPGYAWHRIARAWRTPVLGEILMGSLTKPVLRFVSREANATPGPLPDTELAQILEHFDHGTQRAILKLYRSAGPDVLAAAGERLGELRCPAIVLWGERDPYIPADFAEAYAAALGGPCEVVRAPDAGHWPWLDRPELIERVADFLA